MIRIMIADDCITRVSKYSKFLTETKDIEIVSKTVDKETTLQNYLKLRPDILIISFNMSKDTFELIDSLSIDTEERKKCNIIIIDKKLKVDKNSIINLSKVYCILTEIDYNDILCTIKKKKKLVSPKYFLTMVLEHLLIEN